MNPGPLFFHATGIQNCFTFVFAFSLLFAFFRFAKRKMDNKSFFGGILHVFYAPEYESVDECRHKLEERRKIISRKTQGSRVLSIIQ